MSKEPFFASATARSTTDEAADATTDSDDSLTFVDTILAQRRLGVTLTALCWWRLWALSDSLAERPETWSVLESARCPVGRQNMTEPTVSRRLLESWLRLWKKSLKPWEKIRRSGKITWVLLTLEPRRVLILWVQLASAAGTCSVSGGATGLERPDRPGAQAVLLYHLLLIESKAPFCRASYFRLFQASLDWTFPWIVFDFLHSDTLEI